MWEKIFLNKLRSDAPRWVAQGWLTTEAHDAIIADAEERASSTRHLPLALGVLGALLLGVGVISFFAANWPAIPKLARLAILLSSMWATFAVAGWLLAPKDSAETGIAKALVLLGVILYGSSIFLIAQTFHIQAHFPNGVLFWALGALVAVYLLPIQAVAVLGLALSGLWAVLDHFGGFERNVLPTPFPYADVVYWPFALVLSAFAYVIGREAWRLGAWIATLSFLIWCTVSLGDVAEHTRAPGFAVLQVGLLLGFVAFGTVSSRHARQIPEVYWRPLLRVSLVAGFACFYALTLRVTHNLGSTHANMSVGPEWIAATVLLSVAATMLVWPASRSARREKADLGGSTSQTFTGKIIATLTILLLLSNLFLAEILETNLPIYIAFNILLFLAVIWVVAHGYAAGDRFTVNIGFTCFALTVLTLYFDTFWRLLDRSFFFMAGGILLLVGGYLLERQRRRVMRAMTEQAASGTGATG